MSFIYRWISPLYDAFFCPGLPVTIRWRLLAFQPLVFLTNTMQYFQGSTLFASSQEKVIWIPLKRAPGQSVRAILYHPTGRQPHSETRPLHLNIHGGGFLGGLPEGNAPFCRKVMAETDAVVVSITYRYAPRYTFPIAHEDVQDVADWLIQNAEKLWGANPTLMSVSGFSVGGNLALGIAQRLSPTECKIKAAVLFYTPVC